MRRQVISTTDFDHLRRDMEGEINKGLYSTSRQVSSAWEEWQGRRAFHTMRLHRNLALNSHGSFLGPVQKVQSSHIPEYINEFLVYSRVFEVVLNVF